jgi:hypothetical protein
LIKVLKYVLFIVLTTSCGASLLDAQESISKFVETKDKSVLDDYLATSQGSPEKWGALVDAAFESTSESAQMYVIENSDKIDSAVLLPIIDKVKDESKLTQYDSVLIRIIKNNSDEVIITKIVNDINPIQSNELLIELVKAVPINNYELAKKLYDNADNDSKITITKFTKNYKLLEEISNSSLSNSNETVKALIGNELTDSRICKKLYTNVQANPDLFYDFKNGCGKNITQICLTYTGLNSPYSECETGFEIFTSFCLDDYSYALGYEFQKKVSGKWIRSGETKVDDTSSICTESKYPIEISANLVVENLDETEFRYYRPQDYEYNPDYVNISAKINLN